MLAGLEVLDGEAAIGDVDSVAIDGIGGLEVLRERCFDLGGLGVGFGARLDVDLGLGSLDGDVMVHGNGVGARGGVERHTLDGLAHHGRVVPRAQRAAVRLVDQTAAPSNLLALPDVLDGAHAIALDGAVRIGGVDHGTVYGRLVAVGVDHLLAQVLKVNFVVAVLAGGLKVGGDVFKLGGFLALDSAKAQVALGIGGELLVIGRTLAGGQHVVRVVRRLKQGVLARVGCRGHLALDRGGDRNGAVVGHTGELGPIDVAFAHLDGKRDARDIPTVGIDVVGAARQAGARLLPRSRGHNVGAGVVALGGIEIGVGDVHEHVVARLGIQAHERVECTLQVGDLLGGLGFAKVFLGEQVLGLGSFGLDGRGGPGVLGVLGLIEGRRLVVELLQFGLGGIGHRLLGTYDVVIGRLEGVGVIVVTQGVDGELPVAGAVGALGQLAALGFSEAQLNAHGLVHPVVGRELGAVGGKGVGVGRIVAVIGPGDALHIGAQVAIVAVEVYAQELAVGAARVLNRGFNVRGGLELLTLDTRVGAGGGGREAEGSVIVGHGLNAVGVGIDVRNQAGVSLEVIFGVAAGERLAIGDKAVARLKSLEVAGLDFDGNVLESRDLVVFERVACTVAGHGAAVPRYGLAVGRGERLAVGGPGGQVKRRALVGVDGSHALVAAAVQAVVGGCTGHHVKSALVGLVAGIELARRSGGPCRLHFFTSPILGPREASVAIGVFVGRRGRRILLVIGSLQGIIDGSLDGVGRDRGGRNSID